MSRTQRTSDVWSFEDQYFKTEDIFLMEGFLKKSGLALRGFGSSDSVVLKEFLVL